MGKRPTAKDLVATGREWLESPAHGVHGASGAAKLLRGAAARITTPLLPDDYFQLANPLWSARELRGKIIDVTRETEDSATLTIKTGWGFSAHYQPGQYVGIGVLVEGRWTWRSYSLTSVPADGADPRAKTVTITVKAMNEGFLSSHLVDGVLPGTVVRLAAPSGDFVLPEPLPAKMLFLTAGSGVTPVMSMLRTMKVRDQHPDLVHVHSAPTVETALFATELTELDAAEPNRTLHLRATRADGRLDEAALGELVPDWRERQTWICGPSDFIRSFETIFAAHERSDALHTERFTVDRADVDANGGEITFAKSGKTITVDGATTILDAGERVGAALPFGCRMGICQTCVVPLVEGQTRDLRSGDLHVEGEHIQSCISVAVGDCTIG